MARELKFGAVNGPLLGKLLITTGRVVLLEEDGEEVIYEEVEYIYTDEGLPLMMVRGSSWSFLNAKQARQVIFAHPRYVPTMMDLPTGVVSPVTFSVEVG